MLTWSAKYCQGDNWNDLLKEVITFKSVEEFWGVYVSRPHSPFGTNPQHASPATSLMLARNLW